MWYLHFSIRLLTFFPYFSLFLDRRYPPLVWHKLKYLKICCLWVCLWCGVFPLMVLFCHAKYFCFLFIWNQIYWVFPFWILLVILGKSFLHFQLIKKCMHVSSSTLMVLSFRQISDPLVIYANFNVRNGSNFTYFSIVI